MEAIILAGGMGTRLKAIVSEVPKPMAPINGIPFLSYILDELVLQGCTRVILSVGYKKEIIINYFGLSYRGLEIIYSQEVEPLGTGGAIKKAIEYTREDNMLILNGDTMFKIDIELLFAQHVKNNAHLSIALKEMKNTDRYGAVVTYQNKVINFTEKKYMESGKINGGIYVIKRNVFTSSNLPYKFSFEADFIQVKYDELNFLGYLSEGYFIDIGIPEDYYRAQTELKIDEK